MHVVHKIVYRLDVAPATGLEQTFAVPPDAELVAVGWDTRLAAGVALWYRTAGQPDGAPGVHGPEVRWRLIVRGTGHEFPAGARHLGTVVRESFAWHLFDADGDRVRRAAS